MKRAFIMVLDSFGIGATEDAERFGDVGADTLGHIAEACAKGEADNGRKGPLNLPNLTRLGLAKAHEGSTGFIPAGMDGNAEVIGAYAWAHEMSSGKDTPSGHWEIAGVPVLFEWGYFSDHENSFPQELLDKLVERANLPGYLGNCHSSGTVILDQLGEEHMKTGKPIFYTSADSVFQIACHEETFGLDKLYELCEIAREELTNGGYTSVVLSLVRLSATKPVTSSVPVTVTTWPLNRQHRPCCRNWLMKNTARWFLSVKLQTSTPTAVSPKSESDWPGRAV
ncbi:phosphopentomutase [Escherichia coli]|uniref:Phosphopentomutase n=1 Tax=Escherichia coli TaxID=562 RepID=A0A485JNS8_ECOLX|nr:phosphopentomutase [Escherichia coli]